ncbi:ubiquitin-like modifier-activating enzyme [Raphidocelis subcapitata]|uniref:Ubiquitin-like modifier-activating enzyme ATG7 n=1 Tax=Raphidocelis subcapitata TaxID=307507 RepID=A0A2V0NTN3_9CHLO|nr:ubiquitin-like modifier-activating enzyme [Raphidocelis subcapitata]|eukprot:GBF90994.1 ubiquitin-like modifier-activating enzyme [Raphidocelis subcapitata]
MAGSAELLKFCAMESCVDPSFWSGLASRKLDEYQLSEAPVEITGYLTASRHTEVPSQLLLTGSSFEGPGARSSQGSHALPGRLVNFNTQENFARADAKGQMREAAARIWADIRSGAAEADPSLLSRFFVLAFGDLKRYDFTYWFAFPALKPPAPFTQLACTPLSEWAPGGAAERIAAAADAWRGLSPGAAAAAAAGSLPPPPFCLLSVAAAGGEARALPLAEWEAGGGAAAAGAGPDGAAGAGPRLLVCMSDPSHLASVPGWPLRNLLLLAAARWRARRLSVLCVRDARGRCDAARSFVVDVNLPELPDGWGDAAGDAAAGAPDAVGWETNVVGRLAPRRVDLSNLMSPAALAEQAVDLNLRLMRWRAAPSLDIAALASARCLLLGAGTLGCAVARTLLAWGVRGVTFVDCGRVAFSNPVRQSLFVFNDCLGGGLPKAPAAAEALRAVFPSVSSKGVTMRIPMPGHPPENAAAAAAAEADVRALDELISDHDAVFLLTDSRESRWLPTMLAAARRKVAITAALGFDGFVVMRHGAPPAGDAAGPSAGADAAVPAGRRLGCYFCNDVVAPANSAVDRTLDQQCTVARPGLAPIAGALAVELLAALLQHPAGVDAPAPGAGGAGGGGGGEGEAALGPVPHQIRGQLSGFSQVCMTGAAFSQCTACSEAVLSEWRARGPAFVLEAMASPGALEELTGLSQLHAAAAAAEEAAEAAAAATGADGGGGDEEGEDWLEL